MVKFAFINLSKEEWVNPRRARKQLLFEALLRKPSVKEILYVNPHKHFWQRRSEIAPTKAKMSEWQGNFILPGERLPWVRKINRWNIYRNLQKQLLSETVWHSFFYNPLDVPLARFLFRHGPVFYDWTEDWAVYYDKPDFSAEQDAAIKIASGVVAVTESLAKRAFELCDGKKKILLLPNATEWEPKQTLECPEDIIHIPFPRIGYLGHLGPWLDKDLVVNISQARPTCHWVMVGYADPACQNHFRSCPNVHLLGQKAFNELQSYMAQCQVLVAPYRHGSEGDSTKLYDYLTLGVPIVSSEIATAYRLQPYVRIASHLDSWLQAIDQALNEKSPATREARRMASLEHTWNNRATALLDWLFDFHHA